MLGLSVALRVLQILPTTPKKDFDADTLLSLSINKSLAEPFWIKEKEFDAHKDITAT